MIKITFPAHDRASAAAFGAALVELSQKPFIPYPGSDMDPPEEETPFDRVAANAYAENIESGIKETLEQGAAAVNAVLGEQYDVTIKVPDLPVRADSHGVPFDPAFCADAKDPFYASGKRNGQWKKKRGVSDEGYDAWHYSHRLDTTANQVNQSVDTSAAFGEPAKGAITTAPQTTGEFMVWVSEQQAAGRITQEDLGNAYQSANLAVTDLFDKTLDAASIQANVDALFAILSPLANRI